MLLSQHDTLMLQGVKPELAQLVQRAALDCGIDFTVTCGLRTEQAEAAAVAAGTSHTMQSKHLIQPDGTGHAVDLVPLIGGVPQWDWDGIYEITAAMHAAAVDLNIADNIRWGGCWDRRLSDFGSDTDWSAVPGQYHERTGLSFVDGPHFEWDPATTTTA